MTKRRNNIAFWAGAAVFLVAVLSMTQIVRNEYPFFAGYVILQFIALAVAWSILGGYAGYVNFGTNAFFGIGVYTAVALFKATGAPLVVQIAAAAFIGMSHRSTWEVVAGTGCRDGFTPSQKRSS